TVPTFALSEHRSPHYLHSFPTRRSSDLMADALSVKRRPPTLRLPPWRAGISIVIPERDAPDMLKCALTSLDAALGRFDEDAEIRSEERRVGREWRCGGMRQLLKNKPTGQ